MIPILFAQVLLTLQRFAVQEGTVVLDAPLRHVQGIETDGTRLWVTSVDKDARTGHLHVFALMSGKLLKTVQIGASTLYHPGGMSIDGTSLWIPVAEYKREGVSVIEERDKDTLVLRRSFSVGDHIGCAAVGGGRIYGGNWDARKIYTWNTDGVLLAEKVNPHATRYQDMKMRGGELIASGVVDKESGAVDWLLPDDLHLVKRVTVGKTDRGTLFSNEGMTVYANRIYFLPEDGPSRLFIFRLQ